MEKTKKYKAKVDDIIALCHILEDYREFIDKLSELLYKPNLSSNLVQNIAKASHGEKLPFSARKAKKFYEENKEVIDTINKYTDIGYFINNNYNWLGELKEDSGLDYFHDYIMNHLEKLDKILAVLEKLKQLEFRDFSFEPNRDFTSEEQNICVKLNDNFRINYYDNIELIPTYQTNKVKYRTTDSNYLIVNGVSINKEELTDYDREIILNSLTFDAKRLPEEISKELLFDSIVERKEKQSDLSQKIRNSVDFSTSVDDLRSQYESTKITIEALFEMPDKEKLYRILKRIQSNIEQLQNASNRYDQSIAANNDGITLEQLHKEKEYYLDRKAWNSIDID